MWQLSVGDAPGDQFRVYEHADKRVAEFYLQNHTHQTLDFVLQKKRDYLALVLGVPPHAGKVEAPVGRHPVLVGQSRRVAAGAEVPAGTHRVKVKADDVEFDAVVRIDTPGEANYYRNGGIMQYVLRNLLRG